MATSTPIVRESLFGALGVPRVRLAHLPTPLEPWDRLRAALGAGPRLFAKRDDCTGLALGGNKARKLEYALGEALARGADCLITTGGVQSNHVRQTAAAAARCGLDCHVVLDTPLPAPPRDYFTSGNRLLDELFGAEVTLVANEAETAGAVDEIEARLSLGGRRPYRVALGASDETGSLGYVRCAVELLEQAGALGLDLSDVVLCTGSAGTHAGLLTGLRLAGCGARVTGVSSSEPSAVKEAKVRDLCDRLLRRLGAPEATVSSEEIVVHDAYVGDGYGHVTETARAAIRLVATTEGVLLDPVYTGKAMAGLIDLLARGKMSDARDVVFLHTGGAPALFAYAESFLPRGASR